MSHLGRSFALLLLLLSCFSCVRLCATPKTAAHQAPPSPGFSRQETSIVHIKSPVSGFSPCVRISFLFQAQRMLFFLFLKSVHHVAPGQPHVNPWSTPGQLSYLSSTRRARALSAMAQTALCWPQGMTVPTAEADIALLSVSKALLYSVLDCTAFFLGILMPRGNGQSPFLESVTSAW